MLQFLVVQYYRGDKFYMENNYIFIDFDGVILDSEERMLVRKRDLGLFDNTSEKEFDMYFAYTKSHPEEWDYILRGAKPINNSVQILRNLESMKKKIAILTKIHTVYEMQVKTEMLRENFKIFCPILFVPPGIKKHQIVIPNRQLLIDDSEKNIMLWIQNGGEGLIFDSSIESDTFKRVRSLELLLKR